MAELGTGYITIMPVFKKGIQSDISTSMAQTGAKAGSAFSATFATNTAKIASNFTATGTKAGQNFSKAASSGATSVTSAYANAGATAGNSFFSKVQNAAAGISSHFSTVGQQSGSKFANETSKGAISGMGSLGLAAGMILYRGIRGALTSVSAAIDSAISRVDTLRNFPRVMQGIGQSAEDSTAVINDLSESLMGLPTTLDSAAQSVQRFTATNGDVKKSSQMFKALNNAIIAGASSANLQASAMEQVTQAYSKGKMDMIEWRSLLQAAPAQVAQVAKKMGVSIDELGGGLRHAKDYAEITMDEFMQAVMELDEKGVDGFQNFSEQAKNAVDGIGVSLKNLQSRMAKAITAIIEGIDKTLTNAGLGTIAENIDKVSKKIQELGETAGKYIGELDFTSPFVQGVAKIGLFLVAINSVGLAVKGLAVVFSPLADVFGVVAGAGISVFKTLFYNTDSLMGLIVRTCGVRALQAKNLLVSGFSAATSPILGYLSSVMSALGTLFSPLGKGVSFLMSKLAVAGSAIASFATTVGSNVWAALAIMEIKIRDTSAFQAVSSALSTVGGHFKAFGSSVAGVFTSISDKLVETFAPMATKVAGYLAPVVNVVKTVLAPVGNIIKTVFTPGPLLAISVALAAIGAVAVAVFESTKSGGGGILGLISNIVSSIQGVIDKIGQGVAPAVEAVKTALGNLLGAFEPVVTALGILGSQIASAFSGGGEDGGGSLQPIIDTLSNALQGVGDVIRNITSVITGAMPTILSVLQPVFDAIQNIVTNVLPPIMGLIQAIMGVVMSAISAILPPIMQVVGVIMGIYAALAATLIPIISIVISYFMSFVGVVADALTPVINALGGIVSAVFGTIGSIIGGVIDFVMGIIQAMAQLLSGDAAGAFETLQNVCGDAITGVINFFTELPGNILNALGDLGSLLLDAGGKIIQGLLDGLTGAIGAVWDFVGGIADTIFSLKGPLPYDRKLLIPAGKAIVEGLYNGLEDNIDTVYGLVGGIGDEIADTLDSEIQSGIEKATDVTIPVQIDPVSPSMRSYSENIESHDIITNNYRINDLKINDSPEIARQFEKLFKVIIKKADMYA